LRTSIKLVIRDFYTPLLVVVLFCSYACINAVSQSDYTWGSNGYDIGISVHNDDGAFVLANRSVDTDNINIYTLSRGFSPGYFIRIFDENYQLKIEKEIDITGDNRISITDSALGNNGRVVIVGSYIGSVRLGSSTDKTFRSINYTPDACIISYSSSLNSSWSRAITGDGLVMGTSIATDSLGNVYVSGYFTSPTAIESRSGALINSAGFEDAFLAKYNDNGSLLWLRNFGGVEDDRINDITIDQYDNVLITGSFENHVILDNAQSDNTLNAVDGGDCFIGLLNTDGVFISAESIGGKGLLKGSAIAYYDDSVYVGGSYTDELTYGTHVSIINADVDSKPQLFICCLTANLTIDWIQNLSGQDSKQLEDLIVTDEALYLTGAFAGDFSSDCFGSQMNLDSEGLTDGFLFKFDLGGKYLWSDSWGSSRDYSVGCGLAIDDQDMILVTGAMDNDAFIRGYNNEGTIRLGN